MPQIEQGKQVESVGEEQLVEDVVKDSIRTSSYAKIQNPLKQISREILLIQVETFVQRVGLNHELDSFRKAALVAQSPDSWDCIPELDEADRRSLQDEKDRKWHQPKSMWLTVIVCSIGAAVQGWDQTGSNGANLSFPQDFGIGSKSAHDRWLVGLINSAPPIAMLVLGVWCSDSVNNLVGRRGTVFISAWIALLSVLGSAFTQTWYQLLICRLLLGLGMGLKSSTTSVWAAENAPARIRGALTMTWQLYVACGIFLGLSANLAVLDTGAIAWRLQLGSAFIPAVPLILTVYLCPESPRWYIKKGRHMDAFNSLCRLRLTKLQAARDLYTMHVTFEAEKQLLPAGKTGFIRFIELFTVPRIRRANLAAGTIMLAQQMCGINIIAFYSSTVFVEAGVSAEKALWVSWGFGLVQLLFALPALKTIDTFGRRSLLLATFPNMAWTLLATGLCYLIPGDGTARLALLALFIFLFAAFYAPGEGPVCFPYAAEVYPLSHREIGMSWSVAINAGGATALALTFPYMLVAFTPTGAFGFYCGLNILAFIMIFLWVPETKALTLEELDYVFALPTTRFMSYQVNEALPYFVKRFVLLQKGRELRPLYDMSQTTSLAEPKV